METIRYKNTTISYSDTGKGTAVVLLHGFLENKKMWETFIPVLSQKNRVITIDLLGHGDSECLGYVHSMEENAEVVQSVLKHLRIRKSVFIGHSMGGYVALAFAELFPNGIKGLVLVNSTAKADGAERKKNRDRAIVAVKQNFGNFIRMSIANLFSEDNREKLNLAIEKVKIEALKTPLQGIVASLEGMKIRKDRTFILKEAAVPKLLILGEKDPVLDFEETKLQINTTTVALLTFPDGHMSPIENECELTIGLLEFIRKI